MVQIIIEKIVSLFWVFGPAALVLGFLIFIHEFGHFLAARLVGIRVEVFSIGFGKRLFGFRRGATDYRLSSIPFGGYVRMAGEELPGQSEGEADIDEFQKLSAQYATPGDTLNEKPVPHRMLVAVAGAAMNALMAVILTIGLAYFGIQIDAYLVSSPVIAHVQTDSSAEKAGLQKGDLIVSVAGNKVETWEDAQQQLLLSIGKQASIEVIRQNAHHTCNITVDQNETYQFGGIGTPSKVIVGSITPDSPAEKAGLQAGDHISSFANKHLGSIYELIDRISTSAGSAIQLEVIRNNEKVEMTLTPEFNEEAGKYMIGIGFAADPDKVIRKYPLAESITKGIDLNLQMSKLMLGIFQRLLTGQESVKNLGGPIMIVDMAGKAAKSGVRDLIWLTALISLNLAILNLLPIPILDGGMVLFLIIEALIRRPVSEKIQLVLQNVFFFLMISFALYITYIDVLRINWESWFN